MRRFLIAACALFGVLATPAMAEIGRIKNATQGTVEVIRGGKSFTAKPGFKLEEGDTIATKPGQRVGITFIDDTRMAVGPGSRVTLNEYKYDRARQTGKSLTTVNRGSLGVDSGNITRTGKDRMRVRTPTSTLGVRGTTFVVEVK